MAYHFAKFVCSSRVYGSSHELQCLVVGNEMRRQPLKPRNFVVTQVDIRGGQICSPILRQ